MSRQSSPSQRTNPAIEVETFQSAAWEALCGPATHVLLFGGARSGKTIVIMMWLVVRALAVRSTHAVFRHHFNALKASIIDGSLPTACNLYWPGQKLYELNRSDPGGYYADFVNGSRIYFGGLDDKDRTDKILGQEHSTIYLNEVSQISYGSRLKAVTRLSQQSGMRLKEVSDCNPPMEGHWSHKLFVKGKDPMSGADVVHRHRYAVAQMNPAQNPHIPEETKIILRESLSPRERVRFWDGNYGARSDSALWTYDSIDASKIDAVPAGVTLSRVLVSIDPSGCRGPEDERSDQIGMVAGGLGSDGIVYVLEDASGRYGPSGIEGWGAIGIGLWVKWEADAIVAETNFGGGMVEAVIHTAKWKERPNDPRCPEVHGINVPFREVVASRGKAVRADPVSTLTDNGKVKFVGHFPELFEELVQFQTSGYQGDRSPDRADAFVWLAYALGVVKMSGAGVAAWVADQAAQVRTPKVEPNVTVADLVTMRAPQAFSQPCQYQCTSGRNYYVDGGHIQADPRDSKILTAAGFVAVTST